MMEVNKLKNRVTQLSGSIFIWKKKKGIPNWTVSRMDRERWDVQILPIIVSLLIFIILFQFQDGEYMGFIESRVPKCIINISAKNVTDTFLSLQFTVSILSITLMTYMAESVKERILGVSYKRIFLKKFIFYPNYITMVSLLLLSNFASLFCFLVNKYVMFLIIFVYTYLLIIGLLYLTYIMYSKKSRVYKKIIKIFQGNGLCYKLVSRDEIIKYFLFKSEEDTNQLKEQKNKKIHNSYLAEEIYLLYCFKNYIEEKNMDLKDKKTRGFITVQEYNNFLAKDYCSMIWNQIDAVLLADCRTVHEKKLIFTENNKIYGLCKKNKTLKGIPEERRLEKIWREVVENKKSGNQEDSCKTYIVTVKRSR